MDSSIVDNRIALRKNMSIVLVPFSGERSGKRSEKTKETVTFYVDKEIDRGSSAICYEAYYLDENGNKVSGTLKEFYPIDFNCPAFELSRDDTIDDIHRNQLYSRNGTLDNFLRFKAGYIRPYSELLAVRNATGSDPEAKDLNNYFPVFDLYQGTSPIGRDEDNCSVYVWVKNEPGFVTFKKVLSDVCSRMEDGDFNRAQDLRLVLHCISVLAKAVDTLHLFSLYHLDLKPENFGIKTFRGKADKDVGISLYDINSLYSGRGRDTVVMSSGTQYFRSPEVVDYDTALFGPGSDIYSLGAILYYALVVRLEEDPETGKEIYKHIHFCEEKSEFDEEEYDNIGVSLRNSEFLGDTDETGNSIIFGQLYRILRKSLNTISYTNDNGFYETAEELYKDIEEVITQLGLVEGKKSVSDNTEYYIEQLYKKKETYYAGQNKNGATGVIQWLLYKYPLYDYCLPRDGEEDGCNVLVLGGATYASKFIDLSFELSQVKNCRLNITVVSKDKVGDKSNYLVTRSAMSRFFEIDGEAASDVSSDPYGRLSFVEQELNLENEEVLKDQLQRICKNKNYTYVFISLGQEKYSRIAANACIAILPNDETKRLVSHIVYGKETKFRNVTKNITSLQLSAFDSLDKHKEYDMLRRMAFNAHLVWGDINNIPRERAIFRSKYYYNSSLGNALSIKYKLHSIEAEASMTFDFSDPITLASNVTKIVGTPGTKSKGKPCIIRELTTYEHRRWLVEKATDSWQPLEDISVLHTDTKDKGNRRHPCMVPSSDEFSLYQNEWKNADAWKQATDEQKAKLDPLDRLSINLYQHFIEELAKLGRDSKDLDYQLKVIEKIASQNSLAKAVSADYKQCAEKMRTGSIDSLAGEIDRFNYYKRILQGMKFGEDEDKELAGALKKIDTILFPAVQVGEQKNWKKIDEDFIRSIPFVLTFSTSIHLCIPFFCETGGNRDTTRLFGNVASALVLNPLTVTYVVDGDVALKHFADFKRDLEYCVNTLQNHRLQTYINVVILRRKRDDFPREYRSELTDLSDKIHLIDDLVCCDWNQVKTLRAYLMQKSTKFTAIEINKTGISGLLQSANEFSVNNNSDNSDSGLFPMYSFDSANQRFRTTKGCDFFRYVNNRPHLLVDDLFYSRGKTVEFSEPELMAEHDELWRLYTSGLDAADRNKSTSAWKSLCGIVKDHLETFSSIAKFKVFCSRNDSAEYDMEYSISFPAVCKDSVQLIADTLYGAEFPNGKNKFFKNKPVVTRIDSKSYKLFIKGLRKDLKAEFEKMLVNPFRLAAPGMIEIIHKPTCMEVLAFSLRVERMRLPIDRRDHFDSLLKIFADEKHSYIRSYSCTQDGFASFTFATENYLRLFRNEGNILELHIYRKAIEAPEFDEVRNGATVMWNTTGASNELDVIMIQGFKTYIVEAKATNELRAEYYDKLYPLNNSFGINNVPILVADLNGSVSPGNKIQIQRGEELGIKTIVNANDPIDSMKKMGLLKG